MILTDAHLAAFDLETTAPVPDDARIITAAFVDIAPRGRLETGQIDYAVERWTRLVNPGVEIPAEAAAIHGITTDHAREHGADPAATALEVEALLAGAWNAGAAVVGHNIVYDFTVLDRELRRHHGRGLEVTGHVIDTLCLDRAVDRFRKGKRTLEAACAHYKVALDGAHDSTEDALASARIAWRIARTFPEIGAMSLDDLQAYQREAYSDWAENFEAYLQRAKKKDGEDQAAIDAVHIDRDWPIRYPQQQGRAA